MNIRFNKTKKLIAIVFMIIVAGALSACGSTTDILAGAAGSDSTETPVAVTSDPALQQQEIPPDGTPIPETYGHIVFVSNRDGKTNLYMTSPDGVELTRLTLSVSDDADPQISPDGAHIAFASTVDGNMDVYVLDIPSQAVTRITDAPEKDSSPSWSSDGSRLAFESFRDGNFEIYIANADGSNQTRLTNDPAGDSNPIWSPVANEIAFVSNRFGNADILLLTPSGIVSTLTESSAPNSAPAWSPDGSMIAFQKFSGELSQVCVINRDATGQTCLTDAPSKYGAPVWSPDGAQLAAIAKQSAGFGIDVFNIMDRSKIELHADGVEPRQTPAWSPEGARLVFQAQSGGDMELYVALVPTNEFTRLTSVVAYDGEPAWSKQ